MFTVDKIKELLLRDAGGENESGRAVYILRTATLGQSLFFVLFPRVWIAGGVIVDDDNAACQFLHSSFDYHFRVHYRAADAPDA